MHETRDMKGLVLVEEGITGPHGTIRISIIVLRARHHIALLILTCFQISLVNRDPFILKPARNITMPCEIVFINQMVYKMD